jgi:hypothetical protein
MPVEGLLAAVNVVVSPIQIVLFVAFTVTVGEGVTVTVTLSFALQPTEVVPKTVYVVVTVGVAVTGVPVGGVTLTEGAHVYDVAPLAVNEVLVPLHIVGAFGVTIKVGVGFTLIITFAVSIHPFTVVSVTV